MGWDVYLSLGYDCRAAKRFVDGAINSQCRLCCPPFLIADFEHGSAAIGTASHAMVGFVLVVVVSLTPPCVAVTSGPGTSAASML